jgi:GntR family transcriptional regulator
LQPGSPTRSWALSRTDGIPLHRQLFLVLKDQIVRGLYAPGAALPSEDELCGDFRVSKITVRRALADLKTQGILESRQGIGTSVAKGMPLQTPTASLGLLEALSKTATNTSVQILGLGFSEPPATIASQLGLPQGVDAMHVERLRSKDGVPVMVTESWIPAEIGRGVTEELLLAQPLYKVLMEQGINFDRVIQEITAVLANPIYAGLLQTEIGAPLVKVSRLLYDQNRRPVQHLTLHISPYRSRMVMDISVEAVNSLSAGEIMHDV